MTYINLFCVDTGCTLEDPPGEMDDRDYDKKDPVNSVLSAGIDDFNDDKIERSFHKIPQPIPIFPQNRNTWTFIACVPQMSDCSISEKLAVIKCR